MSADELTVTVRVRWWVQPLMLATYWLLLHTPTSYRTGERVHLWLLKFCTRYGLRVA